MQVGEFLQQKLLNMSYWTVDSIGKENLPADVISIVKTLGSVEVTYLAQILLENHSMIIHESSRISSRIFLYFLVS